MDKAGYFSPEIETGVSSDVVESYRDDTDVFGHEEGHGIRYRTLTWPLVSVLMITEIVTYGTLSLPSSLAVVGIVPGVILIAFLGCFALYTSILLINFKLNHPEVHNMGDAGMILLGPIGREVLSAGTILFAIFVVGGQLIAADAALGSLSDNRLCLLWYTGIFAIPTLLLSLPRALNMSLSWLSAVATFSILVSSIVAMVGAGIERTPDRTVSVAVGSDFYTAFASITNPVYAYAGHFMFFPLISEMKRPQDAKKAAWTLQTVATLFYVVFAAVMYIYIGNTVASPAYLSLSTKWAKAAWGLAIPNLLVAGALYNHTAAKIIFVRLFRGTRHLHDNTVVGWIWWTALVVLTNGAAFVLATGVPIFAYLVGIAASLFASWYTYGLAGAFWLHDTYALRGGAAALRRRWFLTAVNVLTIAAGTFICIGGLYVSITGIVLAYASGAVGAPFSCGTA
ncbi:transmembrane amino acid transporter [Cryomyces antarcticus]